MFKRSTLAVERATEVEHWQSLAPIVAKMQKMMNELIAEHARASLRARSLSSMCGLAMLPDEPLREVFGRVVIATDKDRVYAALSLGLSQVCRPFREIVLGTPLLWSFFEVLGRFPDPNFFKLCLDRSRDHPLDITFWFVQHPVPSQVLVQETAGRVSRRWRSFRTSIPLLFAHHVSVTFVLMRDIKASILEVLTIEGSPTSQNMDASLSSDVLLVKANDVCNGVFYLVRPQSAFFECRTAGCRCAWRSCRGWNHCRCRFPLAASGAWVVQRPSSPHWHV